MTLEDTLNNFNPKIVELEGIDPETAFLDAQREARHLYGNHGATGTIADADGCIVVTGPAMLLWECRRAAQQVIRDGHARPAGPAFVLRLADPAKTRTVRVPVDLTGLQSGQSDDAIDAAIRAKLPDETWGISTVEIRHATSEGDERKGTTKVKTVITSGKGKRVTKYVVRDGDRVLVAHDTLASARGWMRDALDSGSGPLECVAEVVREDGPLLKGEAVVQKVTVIAVATIATRAPGGNSHYLAAGIYPTSGT